MSSPAASGGIFPKGNSHRQVVDSRPVEFGLYTEARVKLSVNLGALEQVWVGCFLENESNESIPDHPDSGRRFLAVVWRGDVSVLPPLAWCAGRFAAVLMVYAAFERGPRPPSRCSTVLGGLWFDALSANPFGASILPLFAVGS